MYRKQLARVILQHNSKQEAIRELEQLSYFILKKEISSFHDMTEDEAKIILERMQSSGINIKEE